MEGWMERQVEAALKEGAEKRDGNRGSEHRRDGKLNNQRKKGWGYVRGERDRSSLTAKRWN